MLDKALLRNSHCIIFTFLKVMATFSDGSNAHLFLALKLPIRASNAVSVHVVY